MSASAGSLATANNIMGGSFFIQSHVDDVIHCFRPCAHSAARAGHAWSGCTWILCQHKYVQYTRCTHTIMNNQVFQTEIQPNKVSYSNSIRFFIDDMRKRKGGWVICAGHNTIIMVCIVCKFNVIPSEGKGRLAQRDVEGEYLDGCELNICHIQVRFPLELWALHIKTGI